VLLGERLVVFYYPVPVTLTYVDTSCTSERISRADSGLEAIHLFPRCFAAVCALLILYRAMSLSSRPALDTLSAGPRSGAPPQRLTRAPFARSPLRVGLITPDCSQHSFSIFFFPRARTSLIRRARFFSFSNSLKPSRR